MEAVHWRDFETAAPKLAGFGRERLEFGPAYLGTNRADGSPRVHPTSPRVRGGLLALYMFPTSPKARDLLRDPRYALHTTVLDRTGKGGEFALRGLARWGEDEPLGNDLAEAGFPFEEGYVRFELEVGYVIAATYGGESNVPTFERWKSPSR